MQEKVKTIEGAALRLKQFVDDNGEELPLPKWKYNKSSIVLTKA